MKNKTYWKKRMESLSMRQEAKADTLVNNLGREYQRATDRIQKDIEVYYLKYADAEGISYASARKMLTDVEKMNWQVSLDEYRQMALDEEFTEVLDSMYARSRISRLEALKTQMRAHVEVLHKGILDNTNNLMKDTFTDTYYRTIYEVQKGTNLGISFKKYNQDVVNKIVSKPWKHGNFSSNLWSDKVKLIDQLETSLTQAFIRGDDVRKTIKTFSEKMGLTKNKGDQYRAARIIQTESAYIAGEATAVGYKSQGILEYEYLATLDTHTSELCRGMDGKPFKLSKKKVGVNYPPLHSFCRSTTAPHFDDDTDSKRAARFDGKTYYVDSDMNYKGWMESFEDNLHRDDLGSVVQQLRGLDVESYTSRKKLAQDVLKVLDLDNIPVSVKNIDAHGYCSLQPGLKSDIIEYVFDSGDLRNNHYKIKTTFHEAYHGKAHGMSTDMWDYKEEWLQIEETFAESSSHYMVKQLGISDEIAPSYAGKLVEMLPRLKHLDKYSNCNTIADFGKVAWTERINGKPAVWKNLYDECMKAKHDWKEYSKQYLDYINDNVDELVDVMLGSMPKYIDYRGNMVEDCLSAIENIDFILNKNEEMVLKNMLIITMNRKGVK